MKRAFNRVAGTLVLGSLLIALVSAVVVRSVKARRLAGESSCNGRLYKLGKALYRFHEANGVFPNDHTREGNWRNQLLPFLDNDFDERASGVMANAEKVSEHFQCPNVGSRNRTGAFRFHPPPLGTGIIYSPQPIAAIQVEDGLENTLLLIEVADRRSFQETFPEVPLESFCKLIDSTITNGIDPNGPALLFADGRIFRLRLHLSAYELKAISTFAGGEACTREDLICRGALIEEIQSFNGFELRAGRD